MTMMSLLRTGCWAAGFPIVSDALFFIIWSINELARKFEPSWTQKCSERSTNLRSNVSHMSRIIAQKIEESSRVIHRIRNSSAELSELLGTALLSNREQLLASKEMISLEDTTMPQKCLSHPPELHLAGEQEGKPIGRLTKAQVKERVEAMTDGQLQGFCQDLGLNCKSGGMFGLRSADTKTIKKRVREGISHVSKHNPFGKCNTDKECNLVVKNTKCVRKSGSSILHVRRGTCECKPKNCYTFKKKRDLCKPDNEFLMDAKQPVIEMEMPLKEFESGFAEAWKADQNEVHGDGPWVAVMEGVTSDGKPVAASVSGTTVHWANEPPNPSVFMDAEAKEVDDASSAAAAFKDKVGPESVVTMTVRFQADYERVSKGLSRLVAKPRTC